jgi:predicted enzyme related to lactoylglutathione lyase
MAAARLITILYVQDLVRSTKFYDAVFGWAKTVDEPVYVEYEINDGARLGLMPQANTRHFLGPELGGRRPSDGCPRSEVYILLEDVTGAVSSLETLGATCASPLASRPWGDLAAYYLDEDGYVLVIAQRAPLKTGSV